MEVTYHPKVEEEIKNLPVKDSSKIVIDIEFFKEIEFQLTAEYIKKISPKIWELRSGRYRLLFGMIRGICVFTNIFYKKTQKTPKRELQLAINRLKQYI